VTLAVWYLFDETRWKEGLLRHLRPAAVLRPHEQLGDAVQRSNLPLWVAYPIYFLLGAVSVVVIWAAVKRLDR
jgi:hypothetical protein